MKRLIFYAKGEFFGLFVLMYVAFLFLNLFVIILFVMQEVIYVNWELFLVPKKQKSLKGSPQPHFFALII